MDALNFNNLASYFNSKDPSQPTSQPCTELAEFDTFNFNNSTNLVNLFDPSAISNYLQYYSYLPDNPIQPFPIVSHPQPGLDTLLNSAIFVTNPVSASDLDSLSSQFIQNIPSSGPILTTMGDSDSTPTPNSTNFPLSSTIPSSTTNLALMNPTANIIYSSSGFDVMKILYKVMNRSNPKVQIGPVDMSCAFIVVDAQKFDFPIIYSSPSFEKLTGYSNQEIVGRNCRFLQSPDGYVTLGSRRRYTDNSAVHQIKNNITNFKESQTSMINYKKDGTPFLNLITIIPIIENDVITHFVGFQVDIVLQSNSMIEKFRDGSLALSNLMPKQLSYPNVDEQNYQGLVKETNDYNDAFEAVIGGPKDDDSQLNLHRTLIEGWGGFIYVLSIKGIILYASPSCQQLFGYSGPQLIGSSISTICHPSDLVPLIRELKESTSAGQTFSLAFRIKLADGNYQWLESEGNLQADSAKGRRSIVLSGRVRPTYSLTKKQVLMNGGFNHNSVWCKVSSTGVIIYSTNNSQKILGLDSRELCGMKLQQLVELRRAGELEATIASALQGQSSSFNHSFMVNNCMIQLTTYLYSGHSNDNGNSSEFLICQIRHTTPKDLIRSMVANPTPPSSSVPSEYGSHENFNSNLFESLEPTYGSSWQYEIHRLDNDNKRLREQIATHTNNNSSPKKAKKHKKEKKDYICLICHRTESPEWRRGPNGPKTLCNSCGIKFSKQSGSPISTSNSQSTNASHQTSVEPNSNFGSLSVSPPFDVNQFSPL